MARPEFGRPVVLSHRQAQIVARGERLGCRGAESRPQVRVTKPGQRGRVSGKPFGKSRNVVMPR